MVNKVHCMGMFFQTTKSSGQPTWVVFSSIWFGLVQFLSIFLIMIFIIHSHWFTSIILVVFQSWGIGPKTTSNLNTQKLLSIRQAANSIASSEFKSFSQIYPTRMHKIPMWLSSNLHTKWQNQDHLHNKKLMAMILNTNYETKANSS